MPLAGIEVLVFTEMDIQQWASTNNSRLKPQKTELVAEMKLRQFLLNQEQERWDKICQEEGMTSPEFLRKGASIKPISDEVSQIEGQLKTFGPISTSSSAGMREADNYFKLEARSIALQNQQMSNLVFLQKTAAKATDRAKKEGVDVKTAKQRFNNAESNCLGFPTAKEALQGLPVDLAGKTSTDAEGRFTFRALDGTRYALFAEAQRHLGPEQDERYVWFFWFTPDKNSQAVMLHNRNDATTTNSANVLSVPLTLSK